MDELYLRHPSLEKCRTQIEYALDLLKKTLDTDGKILTCGNGGSCADSDHIVGELMKGFLDRRTIPDELQKRFSETFPDDAESFITCLQRAIPTISLNSSPALISAFSNDVNSDFVFAQGVLGYGRQNDVLIAISTSGNSKNVVNALKTAKVLSIKSIGLTGRNKSALDELCTVTIHADETETYKIQELHEPIYHYLCAELEKYLMSK